MTFLSLQNAIRNGEKALRDASKPGERPCSKKESNRRDVSYFPHSSNTIKNNFIYLPILLYN